MNTQQPLSLKDLESRYPYQFKDPELGISMAKGWVVVFAQLCADVDQVLGQDKRGFHWSQVKEKFGSARFYFQFTGRQPDLRLDIQMPGGVLSQVVPGGQEPPADQDRSFEHEIRQLAMRAEVATRRVCLVCGQEGSQDVDDGYVLVLCPEHRAQRQQPEGLPPFWDSLRDDQDREV